MNACGLEHVSVAAFCYDSVILWLLYTLLVSSLFREYAITNRVSISSAAHLPLEVLASAWVA